MADVRSAGKCIAFELGTAAGFHLLRALETVVLVYRKHVMPGNPDPNPNNRNLGQYIKDMEENGVGERKTRKYPPAKPGALRLGAPQRGPLTTREYRLASGHLITLSESLHHW